MRETSPQGDDVDLKQIAQTTSGFTGADLENLLNEAAILAAKENRVYIQQSDIRHAFVKVGIGPEKKEPCGFLKKNAELQHITRRDMRSSSMYCRMWDLSTVCPLFRQEEQAVIRCRFGRR